MANLRLSPFLLLRRVIIVAALTVPPAVAQPSSLPDVPQAQKGPGAPSDQNGKEDGAGKRRILWVIPNYRSEENSADIKPLTPGGKFKLAFYDSFDPSAFLVAGVFAGSSMAQNQHRGYGQGAEGYGRYYGAAFGDQTIGNFMTGGVFPVIFRQDPRYFTKGTGGFWKRTGYALSREVVTRGDDGVSRFNVSELGGTAAAAGIANAYYPDEERTAGKSAGRWGTQIGLNAAFNEAKEFWPDLRHIIFRTELELLPSGGPHGDCSRKSQHACQRLQRNRPPALGS